MQRLFKRTVTFCSVFFGIVSIAQQSAVEVVVLGDAETNVVLEMLANTMATRTHRIPIKLAPPLTDGAAESDAPWTFSDPDPTTPPGVGTTILGYVDCTIRADNPHVGSSTGTVKAKTASSCDYTHVNLLHPPPSDPFFLWELIISLTNDQGVEIVTGRFRRQESDPYWPPNRTSSFWGGVVEGTQVDAGYCKDGTYVNDVAIMLSMFWPYNYREPMSVVGQGARTAQVVCP